MTGPGPRARSGEHRGWGRPLSPGPGCGLARRPRIVGVSGASDRKSPLACGPLSVASHRRCFSRTMPGPRSHAVLVPHPAGDTLARSARGGALLPLPLHPIPPCSVARTARPAPPARFPGCSVGWGLSSARGGRCLMLECSLSVCPPTCPVSETSGLPREVLRSYTPGREKEQSLPLAFSGACWPLAASYCFP